MEQLDIIDFTDLLESHKSVNYSLNNEGVIINNLQLFEDKTIEQFLITKDYLYNNNFTKENFIFDLDNIWKFLKFSQKSRAKSLLEKYFILNKDYIIVQDTHTKKGSGGHNKEKILLNLDTFNLFCLKSDTEMSHKIQEYYINLEKILIKSIREEYIKNK